MGKDNVKAYSIDSEWDLATKACARWRCDKIFCEPGFADVSFVANRGPMASPLRVHSALNQSPDAIYVTGQGHGLPELFSGEGGNAIWRKGEIASAEVSGRIIHLLSCNTAQSLGAALVASGCKAYFGYEREFRFFRADPLLEDPLDDPYIGEFISAACEVDRCILAGLTAQQTHERVMAAYDARYLAWLGKNSDVAGRLYWDQRAFRSPVLSSEWGATSASLMTVPRALPCLICPDKVININAQDWNRASAVDINGALVPTYLLWDKARRGEIKFFDQWTPAERRSLAEERVATRSLGMREASLADSGQQLPTAVDVELEVSFLDRFITPILAGGTMPVCIPKSETERPIALDTKGGWVALKDYRASCQAGLALADEQLGEGSKKALILERYRYFDPSIVEARLDGYETDRAAMVDAIIVGNTIGQELIELELLHIARIKEYISRGVFVV